jgi:glycerate kinase
VVGLGGSASTDGGTGALTALGARFLDAAGQDLRRGGGPLAALAAADLAGLRPPPPGGVACLTDVRAPLLGAAGAAAVFGPQKGATPAQVAALEDGLARLAAVLGGQPGLPGAGAAGGTGYGLAAAWGAELLPGSAEIGRIAGLDAALAGAALVITGEGQYDETSATGKVVGAVCDAAVRAGVPAAVVAGTVVASTLVGGTLVGGTLVGGTVLGGTVLAGTGAAGPGAGGPQPGIGRFVALAELAGGVAAAMAEPERWLRLAGRELAGALGGLAGPG